MVFFINDVTLSLVRAKRLPREDGGVFNPPSSHSIPLGPLVTVYRNETVFIARDELQADDHAGRTVCGHSHRPGILRENNTLFSLIRQIVQDLLHALFVFPEGGPALFGEPDFGMRFFALEFFQHFDVASFLQPGHVRG